MFESFGKFALPVKYAITGVAGGIIWLVIANLIQYQSAAGPIATLVALGVGGFVGGLIRQKMNQSK